MKKNTSLPFDVRTPDVSKSSCIKCQRYRINTQPAQNTDYLLHHDGVIHCRHFTKTDWGNAKNYDLCIKSDVWG